MTNKEAKIRAREWARLCESAARYEAVGQYTRADAIMETAEELYQRLTKAGYTAEDLRGAPMNAIKRTHAISLLTKARKNHAKHGDQDPQTLALCIAEEAGEVAQAVLKHYHEHGEASRIAEEAVDLGALCLQLMAEIERMGTLYKCADIVIPGRVNVL